MKETDKEQSDKKSREEGEEEEEEEEGSLRKKGGQEERQVWERKTRSCVSESSVDVSRGASGSGADRHCY